jgi:hypothetical protein
MYVSYDRVTDSMHSVQCTILGGMAGKLWQEILSDTTISRLLLGYNPGISGTRSSFNTPKHEPSMSTHLLYL